MLKPQLDISHVPSPKRLFNHWLRFPEKYLRTHPSQQSFRLAFSSRLLPSSTNSGLGIIIEGLSHGPIDGSALQGAAQLPEYDQKEQWCSYYDPERSPICCEIIILNCFDLNGKVSCHKANWQKKNGQFCQKYGDTRKALDGLRFFKSDEIKILMFYISRNPLDPLRWEQQTRKTNDSLSSKQSCISLRAYSLILSLNLSNRTVAAGERDTP